MTRVEASVALLLLRQEAARTDDARYRVTAATLRKWVQRGHISRGTGGYDLDEIIDYLDCRSPTATVSA